MITEDLKKLVSNSNRIVIEEAGKLYADLLATSPRETGNFIDSWSIELKSKMPASVRISNSAEYADVLARGRRKLPDENGNLKWYGSSQWRAGITPMIKKTSYAITSRTHILKA